MLSTLGIWGRARGLHFHLDTSQAPAMSAALGVVGKPFVARYQKSFRHATTDQNFGQLHAYPGDGIVVVVFECPGEHDILVNEVDGTTTTIRLMIKPSDELKDLYPDYYKHNWQWIFRFLEPKYREWADIIVALQHMCLFGHGSVFGQVASPKDDYYLLVDILRRDPKTRQPLVSPGCAIHDMLRFFRTEGADSQVAALDDYLRNKMQAVIRPALAQATALRRTMVEPGEDVVSHNFVSTPLGDLISTPKTTSCLLINGVPAPDGIEYQLVPGQGREAYTINVHLSSLRSEIVICYLVGDVNHHTHLKLGEALSGKWSWSYPTGNRKFTVNWDATANSLLGHTIPDLIKGNFNKTPVCAHGALTFNCMYGGKRHTWTINYNCFIKARHFVKIGRAEAYWSPTFTCGGYTNAVVIAFLLSACARYRRTDSFSPLPLEMCQLVLGFVPLLQLGRTSIRTF